MFTLALIKHDNSTCVFVNAFSAYSSISTSNRLNLIPRPQGSIWPPVTWILYPLKLLTRKASLHPVKYIFFRIKKWWRHRKMHCELLWDWLLGIFRKNQVEKAPLLKISLVVRSCSIFSAVYFRNDFYFELRYCGFTQNQAVCAI